ncbi:type IV toxin-antitoxin system AbiEi family antitoxin domain-containing protein [Sphingopyxis sp. YR583]|uniref:type IV toxin-antitoxin system AbiEi family antitoxin domain-containing protein n=1 Tax=Sphingopyxis sp. YR583 TaxID=1881047 RepID=UPI00115FC3B4|nr:type IV toxin-antitoxin system AbiEi family antitoxin domain-containing protein [Sphingopyxis sp. YR583]
MESSKQLEPHARLSLRERAIDLAKRSGTVRTKDLEAVGVPRQYPPMMCREGLLIRVGYGVYRAAAEDSRPEESRPSQMTGHDKPSDFYSE